MNRWNLLIVSGFVLVTFSCIDQIDFFFNNVDSKLAVSGLLTDELKRHTVHISYTVSLNNPEYSKKMLGASVKVVDDAGNIVNYIEEADGLYVSETEFRALRGSNYQLKITSPDGQTYESKWEGFPAKSDLQSVSFSIEKFDKFSDAGNVTYQYRANIMGNSILDADSSNRFRWTLSGTYEIQTHPELRESIDPITGIYFPDPPFCTNDTITCLCCTCCTCWVDEDIAGFNVATIANNTTNNLVESLYAGNIEFSLRRFYRPYWVLAKQYTLTQGAYDYWYSIKNNELFAAGVFGQIPSSIIGNIANEQDPEEQIFGYFGVSSVDSASVFISQSDWGFEYAFQYPDTIADDCTNLPRSTNIKPHFW